MTGAINNLASSLAGVPASSRAATKKKAAQEATKAQRTRGFDEYLASAEQVDQVEHVDAIRNLADADQEEAQEDRTEHEIGYAPNRYGSGSKQTRPSLDLNA